MKAVEVWDGCMVFASMFFLCAITAVIFLVALAPTALMLAGALALLKWAGLL